MPKTRSKPFERFGNHVLFKKIDSDAFGDLWRVGLIEGKQIGPLLALRKLTGDASALAGAVTAASPLVGEAAGAPLVRNQKYGVINGEPFVSWEYGGGRSLRHIVDRAREAGHIPIPTDQALAIAEKVAAALEYVSSVKVDGKRILHGTLIPQFVWIYEDGDVRVAGQYLNSGLLASLTSPEVAKEIGPYVAPEIRGGGTPTRATEVYAIGAILYLVVTGQEPPDPASGTPIGIALSNATLMQSDESLPADIRGILEKAMASDPEARYPTAGDVKQAITEVLSAGIYAPTTFNLAFFLHNLLRKEMEGEAVEREKESKVNPEPYLEEIEEEKVEASRPKPAAPKPPAPTPKPVPAAPTPPPVPEPEPSPLSSPLLSGAEPGSGKSKAPLIAAAVIVVAVGAAGVWYMQKSNSESPAKVAQAEPAPPVTQTAAPPEEEPPPLEEPVVTEIPGVEEEVPPTDDAEAARKKAMEDEVNRRVQEEMRKLQDEYNRQLKQQQEAAAAAAAPPKAPQPKPKAPEPVAKAPDNPATADAAPTSTAQPETPEATTSAVEPAPAQQEAAPPTPPPAPPAVKEGDLVVSSEVDTLPSIIRRVDPVYPPIAAKQRISSFVIVSALVDEKGKVIDAKILRGDTKNLGFDEASLKAIRKFTFQPAMKNGKKVKTWHSVPFIFGKQQ